ncbi:hypothetical protein OBBRIDRAFT_4097 [Obba rivulosa]|uniref:Uncharacterized protein n=1 Tax=Obba rivulosa TaxID=1052685 RepID=A0A8E2DVN2_9APHY|nr:hypothetical protein OBBRIDRAFT_4097 [Obba rivulosa]
MRTDWQCIRKHVMSCHRIQLCTVRSTPSCQPSDRVGGLDRDRSAVVAVQRSTLRLVLAPNYNSNGLAQSGAGLKKISDTPHNLPAKMYILHRDTNDTSCPTDFPSCDPSVSPGPAIGADQDNGHPNPTVNPTDALTMSNIARFGRRNMVGLVVFGTLILIGFVLWTTFGKWPKSKLEDSSCCRRRRKRRQARLPDPPKRGIMTVTVLPTPSTEKKEMREKQRDEKEYEAPSPVLQPLSKIKVKFASTEAFIDRTDTQ